MHWGLSHLDLRKSVLDVMKISCWFSLGTSEVFFIFIWGKIFVLNLFALFLLVYCKAQNQKLFTYSSGLWGVLICASSVPAKKKKIAFVNSFLFILLSCSLPLELLSLSMFFNFVDYRLMCSPLVSSYGRFSLARSLMPICIMVQS